MKGISREIVPYLVQGIFDSRGVTSQVFSEHMTGLEFYLNANTVDAGTVAYIRKVLQDALKALEKSIPAAPGERPLQTPV
jgi:hypothetical protein